jgi:hypothetical protein
MPVISELIKRFLIIPNSNGFLLLLLRNTQDLGFCPAFLSGRKYLFIKGLFGNADYSLYFSQMAALRQR